MQSAAPCWASGVLPNHLWGLPDGARAYTALAAQVSHAGAMLARSPVSMRGPQCHFLTADAVLAAAQECVLLLQMHLQRELQQSQSAPGRPTRWQSLWTTVLM